MTCPQSEANLEPLMHAFLDGELTGVDRESFELHLLECPACAEEVRAQARFKAAIRGHLPRPALPPGLKRRVEVMIAQRSPGESRWGWIAFPRLTPAFAAVGVVAALVVFTKQPTKAPVIQQALRAHSVELPMDVEAPDCAHVASWFRGKLGFTVHPPRLDHVMQASVSSGLQGAAPSTHLGAEPPRCQGGRIINVKDHFGAYLSYKVGGDHRINVMVFEGDDESLETPRRRHLGGRDVYFDTAQGASTAAFRGRDGLNYVLTSDLDEEALSQVVEAAFRP